VDVTFVGTIFGGGTVSQTFTFDGAPLVQQTFNFTGFTNLEKVEWMQDFPYHQFDNIVVSAIPEPTTGLMVGLSLLGAAALRRRK